MFMKAFSLFDNKAGMFSAPFFFHNRAMALRACKDMARDTETSVGRHPADFELFEIGEFDDCSGQFSSMPHTGFGPLSAMLAADNATQSFFNLEAKDPATLTSAEAVELRRRERNKGAA